MTFNELILIETPNISPNSILFRSLSLRLFLVTGQSVKLKNRSAAKSGIFIYIL